MAYKVLCHRVFVYLLTPLQTLSLFHLSSNQTGLLLVPRTRQALLSDPPLLLSSCKKLSSGSMYGRLTPAWRAQFKCHLLGALPANLVYSSLPPIQSLSIIALTTIWNHLLAMLSCYYCLIPLSAGLHISRNSAPCTCASTLRRVPGISQTFKKYVWNKWINSPGPNLTSDNYWLSTLKLVT